jgi:hypothetical protein
MAKAKAKDAKPTTYEERLALMEKIAEAARKAKIENNK